VPQSSVAIVPAAGRAERFGRQKLLEDIGGEPLVHRTIRCLLEGAVGRVIVVAPPGEHFTSVPLVRDERVRLVENPDPSRGMFSSIQAGLAAAPEGDPILLLPGDMPFVAAATVAAVLAQPIRPGRVVMPRFDGTRGHPLALPRSLGSEILKADARSSLSELLTALGIEREYVDVADPGVVRDVDVRGDLDQ
jgi:molybdenum cofactor cytidylyltransferase